MMGAATVVESIRGTEAALKAVYHNPIFIALWAVTAVAGIIYIVKMGLLRRAATFSLHIAFVIILAGALITHYAGESGSIHLKEREPSSEWELDDGTSANLPFSLTLRKFTIDYYPGSKDPRDYRSDVEVDGEPVVISMNKILKRNGYRFFQADYDEDLSGSILAVSCDPVGVPVTYAGYLLLLLSMIAFFFEKHSAFRRALRRLGSPSSAQASSSAPSPVPPATSSASTDQTPFAASSAGLSPEPLTASFPGPSQEPYGTPSLAPGHSPFTTSSPCPPQEPVAGKARAAVPLWVLASLIVLAALILAYVTVFGLRGKHLLPVLRSPLLPIHVISIMLSYTLLAITMGIGIAALIPRRRGARAGADGTDRATRAGETDEATGASGGARKERLRDVSLVFLYPAVFLLAFGIFVGAVWANISWGGYWGWDPKETWALVTMLLYSAALHSGPLGGVSRRSGRPTFFRNPTFFHIYIIAAFLAVLITWFGVNYLLGGMHSYA